MRGMDTKAKIHALVEPYGMTADTYMQQIVNHNGYIGLAKGKTFLPPGTMDAGEYLRVIDENRGQLRLAEDNERQLKECLENSDAVPVHLRNVYFFRGQTLNKGLIERHLTEVGNEIKNKYNYIFNLVKTTRIIDGKAFEKEMSALLIQYMAELMVSQEDEARRIVEARGE